MVATKEIRWKLQTGFYSYKKYDLIVKTWFDSYKSGFDSKKSGHVCNKPGFDGWQTSFDYYKQFYAL